MQDYIVLMPFGRHVKGKKISLNERQARFLLLSGHIKVAPAKTKQKKTAEE